MLGQHAPNRNRYTALEAKKGSHTIETIGAMDGRMIDFPAYVAERPGCLHENLLLARSQRLDRLSVRL